MNRARSRASRSNGSALTTVSSSTSPMGAGCFCARVAPSRWCEFIRRRPTKSPSRRGSARWRTSSDCARMPELPEVQRADSTKVDKPWGYEIRWAITDRYLGKILHVNRGEALSLQYHERKDEWLLVSKGTIDIEIGGLDGELEKVRMRAGDTVHMPPLTRHRLTAVEDADIFEVSTPEIDDVVRLEDRYGRATPPPRGSRREPGDTAPQGREAKLPPVR